MNEIDQYENTPKTESLVMIIYHNALGSPTTIKSPQLAIDSMTMAYLRELHGDLELVEEHIPSLALTLILDKSQNHPMYSLASPSCTQEELDDWVERCGGTIEGIPWEFEMGKGATIRTLGHYIGNPQHEAFNPIIDFLNTKSILSGWASGLQRGIKPAGYQDNKQLGDNINTLPGF